MIAPLLALAGAAGLGVAVDRQRIAATAEAELAAQGFTVSEVRKIQRRGYRNHVVTLLATDPDDGFPSTHFVRVRPSGARIL